MLQNRNIVTLVVALLGAAKIVLQAFGVNILTDDTINHIANVAAGVVFLLGVLMTHMRGPFALSSMLQGFLGLFRNRNPITLAIAILGALKIVLQAFGYDVLNQEQYNSILNAVACVVAIWGVVKTHFRTTPTANKQTKPTSV